MCKVIYFNVIVQNRNVVYIKLFVEGRVKENG